MEMPVKSTRLKSAVWNDFDRVKQKDNSMVAICRHCEKKLSASSTSGTSHLKNHLNRCRRKNNRDPAQQLIVVRGKQKDGASGGGGGGLGSIIKFEPEHFKFHRDQMDFMFDQERSRFDLALMIIMHEYPLSMVEHVGFKSFLKNLQPAFQLVSSDTVKSDCMQIYQKEKQKVYEMLDKVPGRISLTADLWTSYQDHGYLCLTAHYFDQFWLPQKKILNFLMVDLLAEQALAETVISCLMEWDIDRKLFSVTFDNNSTNDNVTRIRDRLSQNRLLLSHGRLFHVRCGTHIISLLAQDVLGALHEFTHNIRESVRYVNSSGTMQQKFIDIAQQVIGNVQRNLCLDCPTQWNSTYIMLETALEYRLAFSHLQACDSDYKAPSDDEWQKAKTLINCLKLFVEVTSVFSSMKHPTANLYFPEFCDIHLQLIQWFHSEDELISSVAKEMLKRFNTYWSICGSLLAIAVILDPRFKMKLAEYYYPLIYGINAPNHIKDVASGVKELFNGYAISSTLTSIDQDFACVDRDGHNGSLPSGSNDSRDRLSGFDEFLHKTSENQHVKSELDKYLEEPVFPRKVDFNVLNWWNVNAPKYPILSMMARDVLGVPMSAVAPGLAFSTASKVLDPYRSSLSPDIVQALICTHDWLQNDLQDFEPAPSQSTIPLSIAAS